MKPRRQSPNSQARSRRAAGEGADLGGTAGLADLIKAFGDQQKLDAAFGGRKQLRALAAALTPAKLASLAAELGGSDAGKGAAPLAALAREFGATALPDAVAKVGGAKLAALTALPGGAKGAKALCDAFTPALLGAAMKDANDTARPQELLSELGTNTGALGRLAKIGGFEQKPAAFAALLTTGCGNDPKKFAALCGQLNAKTDLPRLKTLLEGGGLGDAPAAFGSLVAVGCNGDGAQMKTMLEGFDNDTARTGLKRVLDKGGLAGKKNGETTLIDPACLGHLLAKGYSAEAPAPDLKGRCAGLATLLAGLDDTACGKLGTVLEKTGLGAAPGAFAGLVGTGCKGDPADLKAVLETFGKTENQAPLLRALTKGGLEGKTGVTGDTPIDPGCLGHLLRSGKSPLPPDPAIDARADGLATLLKGLDDTACGKLKGVLTEGGLGRQPGGLAGLVGIGCDGKPAELVTVLGAFDSAPARLALKGAVNDGGLAGAVDGTGKTVIDPSCLGRILKEGHKEPVPPAVAPTVARRATGLKDLLVGMDATANKNLAGVLKDGGLGLAPDRVGHVVGLGCDGDPLKLKAFGAAFTADASRKGLKQLIEDGGFGAKKKDGTPSEVSPECLGRLLGTGCEGKPAELDKLGKALDGPSRVALEGVMAGGELGRHPKVLAKLYKYGCLDNPLGADTGDKSPKVLKDMIGPFNIPDGQAEFKEMLTAGGLGTTAGQEDRLGSLVRYAFIPKAGPQKQIAAKLKQLQTSFAGNMGDLKTTVDALVTAHDHILERNAPGKESNQPGKGLRNVINAPGFAGNPTTLRVKFFNRLKTRAADPTAGNPARLSQDALMQNAASFEHADTNSAARQTIGGRSVRVGHVRVRHTRKYSDVTPTRAPNGHGNKTTLYPRRDNPDTDLAQRMTTVIANDAHQPTDAADVNAWGNNGFYQTFGTPDGQGVSTQVGYAAEGGNAAVTQFVPQSGGNCVTINYDDMAAIRLALK